MKKCLICNTHIEPFIDFGKMPIANGFLTKDRFAEEYFFEMKVAFCPHCKMVQLIDQPDREKMFHENYAFFSQTSKGMIAHFAEFADHALKDYIKSNDPFVVEVGSNDGIMLKNFAARKIRHLGIEPSSNVAKVAMDSGINTISEFFDEKLARKIVDKYGKADAYLAANVMCHIPYFHSIAEGINILLKDDGVAMFEDPYLGDVIEKTSYDQIYDEHVFLFSVSSISYVFNEHGMEVIDVEPQSTHGGSMRYVIAHKGTKPISKRVGEQLKKEHDLGLHLPDTYDKFRKNCEQSKESLKRLLVEFKRDGDRVVGYAATSKSTTILNYCGIGSELIEYICDTTPIKQGRFSPGMHIPVKSYQEFKTKYPNYAFLFAWNHSEEIMAKEQDYKSTGGKWIVHVPTVKVLK
ncbi:MAG: class I SAM-dependent methyltransferase [Pseudomonadota bacterium]